MKKVLSIILCFAILTTMLSATIFNVAASTEATIPLNVETTITYDDPEIGAWLYFTPTTNGYYRLNSFAQNCDPVCHLYEDMELISSDDDSDGLNFSLVEYLYAGKTYRYDISAYDETPVSFTVLLTEIGGESDEDETYSVFDYFVNDGTAIITDYYGSDTTINIPESIDGYTVTSVDLDLNHPIDTLNLPHTINSFDNYFFYECGDFDIKNINVAENNPVYSSLDGVLYSKNKDTLVYYPSGKEASSYTVADTVKVLGINAFSNSKLSEIILPKNLTTINNVAFQYCTNLQAITIPDTVTSINTGAFSYCESITEIVLPPNLTVLSPNVFSGCTNLKKITLSTNLETISPWAFSHCSNLSTIVFGEKLTTIEQRAFSDCTGLETISIPHGVTTIGSNAFGRCTNLKNVYIPDSVTSVKASLFSKCDNIQCVIVDESNPIFDSRNNCNAIIETATNTLICGSSSAFIPDSVTHIGAYAFSWCNNLNEIFIPSSVITIESFAFTACNNLRKVTFSSGIQNIGDHAFYETNIESVILPDSVLDIKLGLFQECAKLKSIVILNPNASFEESAWDENDTFVKNCHQDLTVYGYSASSAEVYSKKHNLNFVSIDNPDNLLVDSTNNIAVVTSLSVELSVTRISEETQFNNINLLLTNEKVDKIFDIALTKNNETIQPESAVFVKIPTDNKNAKVYRVEKNNALTDMNATYIDGYMVFTTEHFSKYILAVSSIEENVLLGDTDGDGSVTILDATTIQRHLAQLPNDVFVGLCADTDKDGVISILDATLIQRYLANLITEF